MTKKFFWSIYLSITFSTGYQRVKAKKSEEEAQRIKIKSQQFLTLLFITMLPNELFFLKVFYGVNTIEFCLSAGTVNSEKHNFRQQN